MRLITAFFVLAIACTADAQFVAISSTGSGGRTSGVGRPPALLPNGDVFIVNGYGAAELYQAQTRVFVNAGLLPVQMLYGVASIALADGRAVVTGGGNSNIDLRNFVLLWNPLSRSFRQITGMFSGRMQHAMVQLDADTLLIVGGDGSAETWEIYDLRQEKPLTSGVLPVALNNVTAMDHPSGKIVFLGGTNAVVFDRITRSFAVGHGLPAGSPGGTATAMLADGRILVTGGIRPGGPGLKGMTNALMFDPFTGQQESVAPMLNARFWHAATRLPSGKVLITGGSDDCVGSCRPAIAPAEIFEPSTKSFSSIESLNFPRLNHVPVRLPSGNVLFVGGENGTDNLPGPELYVTEGSGPPRRRAVRH